jgi:hypothetical protein
MGIEKLFTKSRVDRLADPDIQRALNAERIRVRESFARLGDQTKETCAAIIYNTLVRPLTPVKHGKEYKFAPAKQTIDGGVDSAAKTFKLIGRILMTTGRTATYGVRKTLVI